MLKKILVLVILVLLLGVSAKAAPLLQNGGFEKDNAGAQQSSKQYYHTEPMGSVLGWDNLNPTPVSNEVGVEKHSTAYPLAGGGIWRMYNFFTDSSQQTSSKVIAAGETYTLDFDAYSLFGAKRVVADWYTDDMAGTKTVIDTDKFDLLHTPWYTYKGAGTFGDWQHFVATSPVMVAGDVGKQIGVILGCEYMIGWEWNSTWYNSAWAVYDKVRLIPEPMTIALLGLGGLLLRRRK